MNQRSAFTSLLAVMVAQIAASMFLFFRDIQLAHYFGSSFIVDAYILAITVPTLIGSIISAAISNGGFYLPLFGEKIAKFGQEYAWKFLNFTLKILIFLLIIMVFIVAYLSEEIISIIGKNIANDTRVLATYLLILLSPQILLGEVASLIMGITNYFNKHIIYAICTALNGFFAVLFLFFFHNSFGIYSLIIGVLLTSLLQLLISYSAIYKEGFKINLIKKHTIDYSWLKEILSLSWPMLISLSVSNISLTIDRIMAGSVGTGYLTKMYFAQKILQLPLQVFPTAIITIYFPLLIKNLFNSNLENAQSIMFKGIRLLHFFLFPCVAGIISLGIPIIELIYKSENFTDSDIVTTSNILVCFMGELLFFGIGAMASRYLMAEKRLKILTIVSVTRMLANIVLNIILTNLIGIYGIPLATSITACLSSITLLFLIKYHNKISILKELFLSNYKILLSSVLMGIFSLPIYKQLSSFFGIEIAIFITITASFLIYIGSLFLLKAEELVTIKIILRERLNKIKLKLGGSNEVH